MDEFIKRLIDYFEPSELVDILGVTTEETIGAFYDDIIEKAEDLEDYMLHGK